MGRSRSLRDRARGICWALANGFTDKEVRKMYNVSEMTLEADLFFMKQEEPNRYYKAISGMKIEENQRG